MNTIEFDIVDTYDEAEAEAGKWYPAKRGGKVYFEGLCRFLDTTSTTVLLDIKRAHARLGKTIRGGEPVTDDDRIAAVVAHMVLKDWKGVTSKGKEVPFSAKSALEYLSHPKNHWISKEVVAFASDVENFPLEDEEFAVEEISKN